MRIIAAYNELRCQLAARLARSRWSKGLAAARTIAPSTTSLVGNRRRSAAPLPMPACSHLIYHQETVDRTAAENSIETLVAQLPIEDEVLILDVGGAGGPDLLKPFQAFEWATYSSCRAKRPEQRSYTFGLNAAIAGLKASRIFVWRTDYVYPPGLYHAYCKAMESAWFAAPYDVLVGRPEVDSTFVRAAKNRLNPFDETYWGERSTRLSLYETQDPALFAITRQLWNRIGGLNHELWGYGWQFAEFAVRVRRACPRRRIAYFNAAPPLHQTHEGSQMHNPAERKAEAEAGRLRFVQFLGGEAAYEMYRLKQRLAPNK